MKKLGQIIVGSGFAFGDEGKGTMTDYWTRKYGAVLVVRYTGGPQAAHNVVDPNGRHHTFAQYGSGTLAGVETYLSEKMLVDPLRLWRETETLEDQGVRKPARLMVIDPQCLVVTPFHARINQMREISRGEKKHGSCGVGVGEAAGDEELFGDMALRIKDLSEKGVARRKLDFLWQLKIDAAEQLVNQQPGNRKLVERLEQLKSPGYPEALAEAYSDFIRTSGVRIKNGYLKEAVQKGTVVFEGAQGVLLDRTCGFRPYVTKTDATFANADRLIGEFCPDSAVKKIGILRAYCNRHGAGPFPTEDPELAEKIPDRHNLLNEWQGPFRIGWLDRLMARYAMEVAGQPDSLVLTNLDRMSGLKKVKVCTAYEYIGSERDDLDRYFRWEYFSGKRVRVRALKIGSAGSDGLAEALFRCRPIDFVEFDGWRQDISGVTKFESLPKPAREYVSFLVSQDGLGTAVSAISVGPTWTDKFAFRPSLLKE